MCQSDEGSSCWVAQPNPVSLTDRKISANSKANFCVKGEKHTFQNLYVTRGTTLKLCMIWRPGDGVVQVVLLFSPMDLPH